MGLTECTVDTTVIAVLGTTPEERALTTDQFKAKFDKEATDLVAYINDTLIPELDAALAAKLALAGGTMTGALVAQNNTNYGTAQARNITLSTSDPSGGGNGDVWIKYTA